MKKSLFIISTICAIILIIVFCIFVSQNNTKSDLVNSQKNKVVSFYKSNINNLNKIKDYLWDKNYTIIHIESNGNALLTDGTSVYLSDIIKNITPLYNDSKELNIDKDDTVGFGDGVNDISMFEVVGCSVAVDNANDKHEVVFIELNKSKHLIVRPFNLYFSTILSNIESSFKALLNSFLL